MMPFVDETEVARRAIHLALPASEYLGNEIGLSDKRSSQTDEISV
jgi:hypothetical protein